MRLPIVLAQMVGGRQRFEVAGATIGDALQQLVKEQPVLGLHLFDESGSLRRHVRCFHNEIYARGDEGLRLAVRPGDTITILNSVAGG